MIEQLIMGDEVFGELVPMTRDAERGPRWIDIPSIDDGDLPRPEPGQLYHDLGLLYPDAPVPRTPQEIVVRRAILHDVTGLDQILDWAAEGEVAIVELGKILDRGFEFETAIKQITDFIVNEVGGSLVQLGEQRLLILPPGVRGVAGLEHESFEGPM